MSWEDFAALINCCVSYSLFTEPCQSAKGVNFER